MISIIGSSGRLGKNLYRYFEDKTTVKGYDLVSTKNTWEDAMESEIIFLCLPTPYIEGKEGYDLTAIESNLSNILKGKIVVIKSTILPGTTDYFQKKYPHLNILFCPEFLTEKTAWEDTTHPDVQIIGFTKQSYKYTRKVLDILPEAQNEFILPALEAEIIKIARNNYFVNKIVFMNLLYDLCEKVGANYENVRNAFVSDRRIRRSHTDIWHQGGRGGSGTCFPKDSSAFRDWAKDIDERAYEFINHYVEINMELIKESNKPLGRQYYVKKLSSLQNRIQDSSL